MAARESDSSPLPLAGEVARRAGEGNGESTLSMERHRSDCPHPSPLPQAGEGAPIFRQASFVDHSTRSLQSLNALHEARSISPCATW